MEKPKFPWYWVLPVVFTVLGSWANFGLFWFNARPPWPNTAVSLGYLLFWCIYPFVFREPYCKTLFLSVGLGTLIAPVLALPLVLDVFLYGPWYTPYFVFTCLLVILFSIPLTGLAIFLPQNNPLTWSLLLLLGSLWTLTALFLKFQHK